MKYLDMLSRLGTGNAHPGGFTASLEQFRSFPLPRYGHILEVGCGTGRTACYLAEQGYQVTAVDVHAEMLAKAARRAEVMGVNVRFMHSDVCALPFPEQHYDVIIAESVFNFTDMQRSIPEIYRVLKVGGVLYDREMLLRRAMPIDLLEQTKAFFGFPQLLSQQEWSTLLQGAHFSAIDFFDVKEFTSDTTEEDNQFPDSHQIIDEGAFLDATLWKSALRYNQLIAENKDYLVYGLIRGMK
jgi:ubiquinone/menaquinone biosynthesis C-methylase UbiE